MTQNLFLELNSSRRQRDPDLRTPEIDLSPTHSRALERELSEPIFNAAKDLANILDTLPNHTDARAVLSQVEAIGRSILTAVDKIREPELGDVELPPVGKLDTALPSAAFEDDDGET